MTIEQLREKDRTLTKIQRRIERDLRTASQLVSEVRAQHAKQLWGLEIGATVKTTNRMFAVRDQLLTVRHIDYRNSRSYGKKPQKPWVEAQLIAVETDRTEWINLFNDWEVIKSEP